MFLEVGRLLAAMVAGLGLLHYDKVGTAIKPSYPFVLLPCLLPGRVGGMVPLPSGSSQGRGVVSYNFHSSAVRVTYIPDKRSGRSGVVELAPVR